MKSLCVKCNVELQVKTNDVAVIRILTNPPTPWQVWNADLLACPKCGVEIVTGFGRGPFAEWGEMGDFPRALEQAQGRLHIRSYESMADADRLRDKPLDFSEVG